MNHPGNWTISVAFSGDVKGGGKTYAHASQFSTDAASPWCSFKDETGVEHVVSTRVHAIAEKAEPAYFDPVDKKSHDSVEKKT